MYKELKVGQEVIDRVLNESGVVTKLDGDKIELYFEDSDCVAGFPNIDIMNDWLAGY
jgi:hypothetical protein